MVSLLNAGIAGFFTRQKFCNIIKQITATQSSDGQIVDKKHLSSNQLGSSGAGKSYIASD